MKVVTKLIHNLMKGKTESARDSHARQPCLKRPQGKKKIASKAILKCSAMFNSDNLAWLTQTMRQFHSYPSLGKTGVHHRAAGHRSGSL